MVTTEDLKNLLSTARIRATTSDLREEVPLVQQGLDSLDVATLLHEVEQKYKVLIAADASAQLRSLQHIADYLNTPRG